MLPSAAMRSASARRRSGRSLVKAAAGVAAVVALAGAAPVARGDVITEADSSVGVGATDNVAGVPDNVTGQTRTSASFTTITGTLRLRYHGARVDHALGYRLAYTRYLFVDNGFNTLSHNVAWLSRADLTAKWQLQGGANATITRTAGVDPNDPTMVMPQAAVAGSVLYLAGQANQTLSYKPDAKSDYVEVLSASHLRYLESPVVNGVSVNLPRTTALTLTLSGDRLSGRETYLVELAASDMYTQTDAVGPVDPTTYGHTLLGRLLVGWKHDLSPVWSTELEAGPSVMLRLDGSGVLAPAAVATLAYNRVPWSAALIATQTPALNPFLGQATISDQILAHAALPLTRSELFYFGAYGGYVYARVANGSAQLDRAYDQFTGGVSLILHIKNQPFAAAATYSVISQRGNDLPTASVPDYARQYVLISVRGDFAWGPGTPPLFGTPL